MALFSFSVFLALFVCWYFSEKTKYEEAVSKEVVSRNMLTAQVGGWTELLTGTTIRQ